MPNPARQTEPGHTALSRLAVIRPGFVRCCAGGRSNADDDAWPPAGGSPQSRVVFLPASHVMPHATVLRIRRTTPWFRSPNPEPEHGDRVLTTDSTLRLVRITFQIHTFRIHPHDGRRRGTARGACCSTCGARLTTRPIRPHRALCVQAVAPLQMGRWTLRIRYNAQCGVFLPPRAAYVRRMRYGDE